MDNLILTWVKSFFRSHHGKRPRLELRLVVVDDYGYYRKGMCIMLEQLGYSILFTGSNGKDVIEKIDSAYLPDIVILDLQMPGMDGFETLQWLKVYHPSVKVLGLGLEDNDSTKMKLLVNGANGYVLKYADPWEIDLAIQTIAKNGCYFEKGFYKSDYSSLPG